MTFGKKKAIPRHDKRENIKNQHWPEEEAWEGANETGWFTAPRTLPLILQVIDSKKISGNSSPSRVYIELLSRHLSHGIIELGSENDHAYASGYTTSRGIRTWKDQMKTLEEKGFIKTKSLGSQLYKFVIIVHPAKVMQKLYDDGLIEKSLWEVFQQRQQDVKESFKRNHLQRKTGNIHDIQENNKKVDTIAS